MAGSQPKWPKKDLVRHGYQPYSKSRRNNEGDPVKDEGRLYGSEEAVEAKVTSRELGRRDDSEVVSQGMGETAFERELLKRSRPRR